MTWGEKYVGTLENMFVLDVFSFISGGLKSSELVNTYLL